MIKWMWHNQTNKREKNNQREREKHEAKWKDEPFSTTPSSPLCIPHELAPLALLFEIKTKIAVQKNIKIIILTWFDAIYTLVHVTTTTTVAHTKQAITRVSKWVHTNEFAIRLRASSNVRDLSLINFGIFWCLFVKYSTDCCCCFSLSERQPTRIRKQTNRKITGTTQWQCWQNSNHNSRKKQCASMKFVHSNAWCV